MGLCALLAAACARGPVEGIIFAIGLLLPVRHEGVYDILRDGTAKAVEKTNGTLARVRKAMRIDYFDDRSIVKEWKNLIK